MGKWEKKQIGGARIEDPPPTSTTCGKTRGGQRGRRRRGMKCKIKK